MADVMPEVGAFGCVKRDELRRLHSGSVELSEFARGALADFGSAFNADAEMPIIRRKPVVKGRGGRFGRVLFGFEKELHELRADEIARSGANWRAFDEIGEGESVFVRAKRDDEAAAGRRSRKSAEVEPRDDGQSAERADEKFVKVVARDILDHASPAFAEAAGAVNELGADEEIARGPVRMAKGGIHPGCDDAADGGLEIERNGEREELTLFVERGGEVVEAGAGIHADREIAGIVVGDLMESRQVEGDVVTRGRHANFEFGAVAAGDESEFFERGEADDFGNLFGGRWFSYGRRNDFVSGVLRTYRRIGSDMRSAEDGLEAGSEI